MANATTNLTITVFGKEGYQVHLPVDGASHIYKGTLVAQLAATGALVPGSTAASGPAIGVAQHEADNSAGGDGDARCMIESDRIYAFANDGTDTISEALPLNSVVYMVDDHTVADDSSSGSRFAAGLFKGMEPDGRVRVLVNSEMVVLTLGLTSPA